MTDRRNAPSSDTEHSAQPSPMWRWGRWLTTAVCGLLIATAALPLLPVDWWWVRIGDYPRVQLACFYVVGLLMLLPFWKQPLTKWLAGLLVAGIAVQLYWIFPYLPFAPHEVQTARSDDPRSRLRVLTANVLQDNQDMASVLELIQRVEPDVVVLLEVNDRWMEGLSTLDEEFSFQLKHPLENTYGIAFYTNLEVTSARVRAMVKEDIPSIDAMVKLPSGRPTRLFAVHPNPPRPGEDTTKRDAELVLVGREVSDDPSVIVMGDMNDVGWSRTTNLFQEVSNLLDPRKGRGMYSTFDATSMIWRYPLDYLFHSDDFRVVELKTLPDIGSDHFPLLVELSHEPDAQDAQVAPHLDAGDRDDAQDAVDAVRVDGE